MVLNRLQVFKVRAAHPTKNFLEYSLPSRSLVKALDRRDKDTLPKFFILTENRTTSLVTTGLEKESHKDSFYPLKPYKIVVSHSILQHEKD